MTPLDSYPHGVPAAGRMLPRAYLAGMAIGNSMLHAAHACANPLSARYGAAHSPNLPVRLRAPVDREIQSAPVRRRRAGGLPMRLVAILAALPGLLCGQWPQFRGNPELTGVSTAKIPAQLKVLWSYEAGDTIESSPVIDNGVVYIGVQSAELLAIDLASGKLKWKYKTKEGVGESTPAVGGGMVFIGDLMGVVHGVNARDGKGVWTFSTGSEVKSSPVIAGEHLLIGSYDGNLYCLDTKTGKVAWSFHTNGPVHATPSLQQGLAFISGCDGVFRAISVKDGKEMYQITTGSYMGASPAMYGDLFFVGTYANEVLGLDRKARKIVWSYEHPVRKFPFYSSAAVIDGKVILADATNWCTASRRRPGNRCGSSPRGRGSNRRRQWRAAASTWGRMMAGCTCSTPPRGQSCPNLMPAGRSHRAPLWRMERS